MIERRAFISSVILGLLAAPLAVEAQQAKVPRIGVLVFTPPGNPESFQALFRAGLRELGYVEGQNILVEYRWVEGKVERLTDLAAELVRLKVDVIVAAPTSAIQAAKSATSEIPIVMVAAGEPVGTGLVASLARPGGNVTGTSSTSAELVGKRLELIREVVPSVTRVAALAQAKDLFARAFLEQIQLAAPGIGLRIQTVIVRGPEEFEGAFTAMVRERAGAVVIQPMLATPRAADLALKHRLPAASAGRWFAEAGGLISYGPTHADLYRHAAYFVDRILKGAKPGDLPVEQSTRFELVINMKTAKALGLTIPPSVLIRADQVIQ